MTDVLSAAHSYHARLKSELHRIEEFLRFAQELERRNAAAQQAAPTRPNVAAETARAIQATRQAVPPAAQAQAAPKQAAQPAQRASLFRGAFAAVGHVEERTAA